MAAMRCDEWQRKDGCGSGCSAKAKPEVVQALFTIREGYGKDEEEAITPQARAQEVLDDLLYED